MVLFEKNKNDKKSFQVPKQMEEPQGSINISHTIKNLRDSKLIRPDKFKFKINLMLKQLFYLYINILPKIKAYYKKISINYK